MKIIYPPFGYKFDISIPEVIMGIQGAGLPANSDIALTYICENLIEDPNFIISSRSWTHDQKLEQLEKIGFMLVEEDLPGKEQQNV